MFVFVKTEKLQKILLECSAITVLIFRMRLSMKQTALAYILLWVASSTYAVSVSDFLGHEINLPQPAQRIITLTPHATELMFSVGAGGKLVGAVEYSDFPEAAKKIPQVGNYAGLNIEAIVALQPDVIIYWPEGNPSRDIERLKQLKMPLFASDPNTFVEIANDIKRFGALTGNNDESEKIAQSFLKEVDQVRENNKNKQMLRVFYQVWDKPLLSQNGDTFISRVINLCGGENIFAALPIKSPQISIEAVLTENPDIILVGATNGQRPAWLDGWQQYSYLKAVKNNQLKTVDADVIHRPTLRLLDATKQVCAVFDELRSL